MGKRVDLIFIYKGIIFVIEFKVNAKVYEQASKDQAIDYALDLKNFHEASRDKVLVPVLVATDAPKNEINKTSGDDNVYEIQLCNVDGLASVITEISADVADSDLDPDAWLSSQYRPTPTIIEAARSLYNGHDVEAISQSEGGFFFGPPRSLPKGNSQKTTVYLFSFMYSKFQKVAIITANSKHAPSFGGYVTLILTHPP